MYAVPVSATWGSRSASRPNRGAATAPAAPEQGDGGQAVGPHAELVPDVEGERGPDGGEDPEAAGAVDRPDLERRLGAGQPGDAEKDLAVRDVGAAVAPVPVRLGGQPAQEDDDEQGGQGGGPGVHAPPAERPRDQAGHHPGADDAGEDPGEDGADHAPAGGVVGERGGVGDQHLGDHAGEPDAEGRDREDRHGRGEGDADQGDGRAGQHDGAEDAPVDDVAERDDEQQAEGVAEQGQGRHSAEGPDADAEVAADGRQQRLQVVVVGDRDPRRRGEQGDEPGADRQLGRGGQGAHPGSLGPRAGAVDVCCPT